MQKGGHESFETGHENHLSPGKSALDALREDMKLPPKATHEEIAGRSADEGSKLLAMINELLQRFHMERSDPASELGIESFTPVEVGTEIPRAGMDAMAANIRSDIEARVLDTWRSRGSGPSEMLDFTKRLGDFLNFCSRSKTVVNEVGLSPQEKDSLHELIASQEAAARQALEHLKRRAELNADH